MSARDVVVSGLLSAFDVAAAAFRAERSQFNYGRLQSTMLALQCADEQSDRVLSEIVASVPRERWVAILCTYQHKLSATEVQAWSRRQ